MLAACLARTANSSVGCQLTSIACLTESIWVLIHEGKRARGSFDLSAHLRTGKGSAGWSNWTKPQAGSRKNYSGKDLALRGETCWQIPEAVGLHSTGTLSLAKPRQKVLYRALCSMQA